jgi:hypothetical protein
MVFGQCSYFEVPANPPHSKVELEDVGSQTLIAPFQRKKYAIETLVNLNWVG